MSGLTLTVLALDAVLGRDPHVRVERGGGEIALLPNVPERELLEDDDGSGAVE